MAQPRRTRRAAAPWLRIGSPAACGLMAALCLMLAGSGCSTRQSNPPAPAVAANPEVARILEVSCYHCHSDEGTAVWYAKLQPSRWFGDSALAALNFSDWPGYDADRRSDAIRQVAAAVESGTMPPHGYLLFHPQARLNGAQKAAIQSWAAGKRARSAH